ncbi:MAG: hypothetical protein GX661_05620, partial [Acholeplasmataceae bacterium]|nr:hypothetical protein [Acholeplasmataceae bacterium]
YIRNEGDLTVDITFTSVNTFKLSGVDLDYSSNLRIAGLIGTLEDYDSTEGYHIYNSYNGGNITITNSYFVNGVKTLLSTKAPTGSKLKTQTLQYMLYIGGIAIRNNSNQHITEADVTNVMISSSRKGTIHNCLNDGDIYVDLNLYGCSRIGGICSINNGLISTCFNTGVIYNYVALYLSPQKVDSGDMGSNDFEVEVGGITCMIGDRKGQIMDCANYGNIYCINPVAAGAGWLNAAGIVGRNEKKQDNTGNPQTNWAGKVQFCVNYGDIYSWNQVSEPFSEFLFTGSGTNYIGAESSCKAAGIIAIGVLNVINCANYGNIYSRYLAGGIFGLVDGTKFTEINSDIYIANSINYGIVRRLTQFNKTASSYPEQFGEPAPIPAPRSITISSVTYKINSMFGGAIGYIYGTSGWARAGISTSSSGWSESAVSMLTHLQISFLINFDDQANIIGSQTLYKSRTPLGDSNTQKYSKMVRYMATTKNEDQSMYPFNSFTYTYSSTTYTVNASYQNIVYSVPEYPLSKDSGGIFADDFPLRGGDLDYSITTNAYIRNYINFVDYDYTNKTLVNKIFTDTNDRIGIYAVASSKGILNGYYLPDNINWGSVSDPGLDPITNGAIDSSWRGDLTSQDNLKWKFEVGMRQVSNEIAATVFDLELTDGQGRIIDAPIIDHQNKIINFYVGDNEGAEGGGNHVVQSYTVSNPTIDTNAKTITYSSSGQVLAKYDYSSGQLVRIDSNLTAVSFGSMAYFSVTQYEAGTITNYYVRRNNNYQQATDSDRLFTVTQGSTYGFYTRSSKTLSSATVYDYTYNSSSSSSRYMISANELTNRNLTTTTVMYRITNTTNYTAYYRQQTIPADYELYVAYPTSITVSVNYYENYYTVNTADNSYRLAEGASIDLATAQNISIPIPGVVNGRFTSSIGTNTNNYLYIMPGAETPQGAQPLAPTRYEIRINRIPDKQLSNLQIRRNGTIIAHQNGVITNALQKNTTQVLEITYTSVNIPDKQNLMRYTVFQKWDDDLNHYEDYSSESAMGTTYTLSGGKVVNKTGVFNAVLGEYDSAQLVNGVFPNGQLTFTLEFYNIIPAGQYRLYTEFCSTVYAVEFEILRSNVANIEEMTYVQGFLATSGTWVNTNNVTSLITYLRY